MESLGAQSGQSPPNFLSVLNVLRFLQLRHSLKWTIVLPIPLIIAVAIICISILVPKLTADNARETAVNSAIQTATQFRILREYYTESVISKAMKNGALSPSHDHQTDSNAIPLPATFIHDMSDLLKNENTTMSLYSALPFPFRNVRVLDDFQREAWRQLSIDPESIFTRQVDRDGSNFLRVAIADRMVTEACVNCHNSHPDSPKTDWKLGDVRGILEINTSIDDQLAAGAHLANILILIAGIGGGFVMLIALFLGRRISLPLLGMAQTMTDIADGKESVRISGAERRDEIGATARALEVFKRSVDTIKKNEADLLRMRDTLEQRVVERTYELDHALHIAEEANRAKSDFLATISHELRTPLNAIIGFSEIMKSEAIGPIKAEKYQEYATDINYSGQHLLDLINDILDLTKVEAGKFELKEENVDVAGTINACVVMVSEAARSASLTVEQLMPDRAPVLRADPRLLKQILVNLLSNAVKFTEAGGNISIRAYTSEAGEFVIQVSDTGIGIKPENISKVMAVFGQVDNSLSRKHEGSGLGLPLTKGLVERHGGSLTLESEVGVGTVVTLQFPTYRIVGGA